MKTLLPNQSELNQIDQLFQQKKEAEQQVINAARALQKVTEAALTSQRQQIDQHTRIAQGVITITGLLALILGCMLAWIIIRGVRDDIKKRQSAEQELLEANRQAQQQSHFKSGLADLNEVMRGEQVLNVLSENILNFLSRFLNLPISALYIKDDSDQLARTATFAYPQQSDQQKRYQMSEGMVGQAAQSATTLLIEPVEAIFSADLGIAEVVPAQLLFQPLIHNNNVIGVLELAALKPFEPAQRQWLDQAAVAIAVAIRMAIDLAVRQQSQVDLLNAKVNADSANRAKSDFLANMSHEIRTPMNAIIGMSHLALKTDLSAKQRNYIEKVHLSAELLLGVINDILDFSKIEAKKLTMEQIPFQLENVLDNLANLVGMKAEEQGLELLFDTAHDIPSTLIGDPLRLGQVLVNLGNNAVKFTEQGEIVLTVRRLEQHQDRIKLQFSIRDTGIGMTPEQQNKLFQSFSQADTSTTRKFGGTGLGLTISKHLVEMMDGEVWVESEFGQGTTFHFTACFGCNTSSAEPPKLRHDLHGVHTLVVDDNPTAREIMATM